MSNYVMSFFNSVHLILAGNVFLMWLESIHRCKLEPDGEGALGFTSSNKRLTPKKKTASI